MRVLNAPTVDEEQPGGFEAHLLPSAGGGVVAIAAGDRNQPVA
jgi:hypothetical protein